MAHKHSVKIRIGAAYDDVTIQTRNGPLHFDRAALNQRRQDGKTPEARREAKDALYGLRKGIVDAFVELRSVSKDRRAKRRNHALLKDRRRHASA